MSTTLTLFECLFASGVRLADLGRTRDARITFQRLLKFAHLPERIAREAHRRLGELHLDAERYRSARRHLRAALRLDRNHAPTRFLLAEAIARDSSAEPAKAWGHYRRAVLAEPQNPAYLAGFAELAYRLHRDQLALRLFRAAHRLAPDSPKILETYTDVLSALGRIRQARGLLIAARFRSPHDARIERVWNEFRFQLLSATSRRDPGSRREPSAPVVLAFRDAVGAERGPVPRTVRHDAASRRPAPHFLRLTVRQ